MKEKYTYINPEIAHNLIERARKMRSTNRGIDRHVFLIDDYAVLSTNRLKLRNVDTRDEELVYFEMIMDTLMKLYNRGVSVVPILGYCCEEDSEDGKGYIIQNRARGLELYNDAILTKFYSWTQNRSGDLYLKTNLSIEEAGEYLISRTKIISNAPQEHFDKFISDMICIFEKDIMIDCNGKSNFFYDSDVGFQFIDLDSHNEFKYGLSNEKIDIEKIVSICGFAPCHYAVGTQKYAAIALDEHAILLLENEKVDVLKQSNKRIFAKCLNALRNNGISEARIHESTQLLCIFGVNR